MAICSGVCNLRRFHAKLRSMNHQVLFRLFRIKTAQSTTAITSIVCLDSTIILSF
ncbi:hypothetical protein ACWIUD_00760 [Helicobacter sp. 23-1044]